jgi:hypothetical protein
LKTDERKQFDSRCGKGFQFEIICRETDIAGMSIGAAIGVEVEGFHLIGGVFRVVRNARVKK